MSDPVEYSLTRIMFEGARKVGEAFIADFVAVLRVNECQFIPSGLDIESEDPYYEQIMVRLSRGLIPLLAHEHGSLSMSRFKVKWKVEQSHLEDWDPVKLLAWLAPKEPEGPKGPTQHTLSDYECKNGCMDKEKANLWFRTDSGVDEIIFDPGSKTPRMGVYPKILPETNKAGQFFRSFFQNDDARITEHNALCLLCDECKRRFPELFPKHHDIVINDNYIAKELWPGFKSATRGIEVFGDIVKGMYEAGRLTDPDNRTAKGFGLFWEGTKMQLRSFDGCYSTEKGIELARLYSKLFQQVPVGMVPFTRVVLRTMDRFAWGYADWTSDEIKDHWLDGCEKIARFHPFWHGAFNSEYQAALEPLVKELALAMVDASMVPVDANDARFAARCVVGEYHVAQGEATNAVGRILQGVILAGEGFLSKQGEVFIAKPLEGAGTVGRHVAAPIARASAAVVLGAIITPPAMLFKFVAGMKSDGKNSWLDSVTAKAITAWARWFEDKSS